MAIDYYGSFRCKVRETVTDAELLRMEKAQNRANQVLELMRRNPGPNKDKPESEWTFKAIVAGPSGRQETELKIGDLLREAAPLAQLAVSCPQCPFNVRSDSFGCGGAIHYPVSARGESWLVARLPDDLSSRAGKVLTRAIADSGYDGKPIDAARRRKDLYETEAAAERTWGGGFFSKKVRITSSQILQMTFGVGSLQPTHAKLVAYFLGFVDDELRPTRSAANHPLPEDDRSIAELKYFFSVAALAGVNDVSVLVDA